MEKTVIKVDGMSCAHCAKAVTNAVCALSGIGGATVDLGAGTVTVEHDPVLAPHDTIKAAIEDQGYDVV